MINNEECGIKRKAAYHVSFTVIYSLLEQKESDRSILFALDRLQMSFSGYLFISTYFARVLGMRFLIF